jgi:hypothetical protein
MALDLDILSDDLDYIISDLPITVTIGGTSYTGTKTRMTKEQLYTDYGFGNEYDFSVILNLTALSSEPAIKTLVTINSVDYIILDKDIDSADQKIELHLGSEFNNYG